MSAELTKLTVKVMEPVKVIGKEVRVNMNGCGENPVPAFWSQCFADGSIKEMEDHPDRLYPQVLVGWMGDVNMAEKTWSYIVGILAGTDADVPAGMVSRELPETRYAVGTLSGEEPDIYARAHELTAAEMAKTGLRFNDTLGYEMEWYDERFCADDCPGVIDLYIPVL